ncbi:hypothetical protein N7523_000115 [Penicillium sp. IBT 18751x]|nr:hypothetical protein N7523_000115 [Penicillium sp. IBT 18751x]
MCSMTFGRPPLIPNKYMDNVLPSNIIFGLVQNTYGLSDTTPTDSAGSELFLQTCKLNLILGDVIETIYGSNIESTLPSSLLDLQQHTIRIENRLSDWKNQLPSNCRLLDLSGTENFQLLGTDLRERRTVVVLSLRYLYLRSLLHRATIYRLLDPKPGNQDCPEFHSQVHSVNHCVESAVLSIQIISHAVQQGGVLPIWWFSAYYS